MIEGDLGGEINTRARALTSVLHQVSAAMWKKAAGLLYVVHSVNDAKQQFGYYFLNKHFAIPGIQPTKSQED